MNVLPQFFYRMVVIGSLSMEGDGGGCGGVGRALEGRWEGVGGVGALGGLWRVVRVGPGLGVLSLKCLERGVGQGVGGGGLRLNVEKLID